MARASLGRSRLAPVDLVRVGLLGLRMRRLRTALSAIGIAIGIAAMVGVLGISRSSQSDLIAQLDELGTNLLTVQAGQTFGGDAATLPETAPAMVARIGPVQTVSTTAPVDGTVRRTDLVPSTETNAISLVAADLNLLDTLKGEVAAGRFLDASMAKAPVLVLGSVTAQRLGFDASDIGVRVRVDDQWFTVGGILAPFPLAPDLDRAAIVGYPAAERYLGSDGVAGTLHVRAEAEDVDSVSSVLAATVDPASPNQVEVSRPSEVLEARSAAEGAFTDLFLGLGAVALLVGGVGIANVMVISVLERRREIGLRRAVGATRGYVGAQFLVEALLLSALGGVGGVALGVLVTAGYAVLNEAAILVPLTAVIGGLAAAVVVGAIAGLYPALRAARLTPTEALRTGG